jgi:hypothetical protein
MTWNDVTFTQYLDLTYYYENIDQYEDELDKIVGLLVVFNNDIDIDSLYSMKYMEVQKLFEPISSLLNTEMPKYDVKHPPFEDYTYGDWINMEHFLKEKDWVNIFMTITKATSIDLDDIKAVHYLPLYEKYMKYRDFVYNNYKEVFKMTKDEIDPDETPEEAAERERAEEDMQRNAQFTWYLHTYSLSKGDVTKFDEIFELNHLFIFNILDMKIRFKLDEVHRGLF